MRRLLALGCLLLVGCAGPHSTGALWSLQNQQREAVMFSQTDAQRAEAARAYELSLADESLAAERARVEVALLDCPGRPRAMAISSGDAVRDSIRVRAQADAARLTAVAQVALADWRLRRAWATGEARFCEAARAALTAAPTGTPTAGDPLLARLGQATVTRHPTASGATVGGEPGQQDLTAPGDRTRQVRTPAADPLIALSLYATQSVDTVRAAAPLPQYLAAIYGGQLLAGAATPDLGGQSPEEVVDDLAPAHPEWEPDALYAALASA
jgi:hypothetical protein